MLNLLKMDKYIRFTLMLYIGLSLVIYYLKPSLMFKKDGTFKHFSLNNKENNTIFPFWLVTTFMGFMIYYIMITCNHDYL